MFSNITGSEYMNIGSLYGVSTNIDFKGTALVNDYLGDHLQDSDLAKIVNDFTSPSNPDGAPASNNSIYFIYTAPNVREQSDDVACAFHSDTGGLKYAWVSGFNAQPNVGCGASETNSITSSASHEFFETLTDPLVAEATVYGPPLGWYDSGPTNQGENGDPCNQESFSGNLNGATYWLQSIFVNDASKPAGGFCASGNSFVHAGGVPEPGTWILFISGIGLAGVALRRRVAVTA